MDILAIELTQLILSHADFLSQIRLRQLCKDFYEKLEVHDFYNIFYNCSYPLTEEILRTYPFITKLGLSWNRSVININYLTKLQKLVAYNSIVPDQGISNLNLIKELNVMSNLYITNINHLTQLEILDISGSCNISDLGIANLSTLKKLDVWNNKQITTIDHMTGLETLIASGNSCGINNASIANLTNLTELHANFNPNITDVNHLTKLKYLHARSCTMLGPCGITDMGITNLNLKMLNAESNQHITDVKHMTDLEILYAGGYCGINNDGIRGLKLKQCNSYNNPKINNSYVNALLIYSGLHFVRSQDLCCMSFRYPRADNKQILPL